jgi:HK97 family phage major capsid protein
MSNAVLARLQQQRDEQITFVDGMLSRIDAEGRDLVQAEQDNLTAARQRIDELDKQIKPIEEFEARKAASSAGHPVPAGGARTEPRNLDTTGSSPTYRSAGAYLVDFVAARGRPGQAPDEAARARIQKAANQTTLDSPGLLPEPVVGEVVNVLDAARPLITTLGPRPMGGIPGTQFSRPVVTQHTRVGKQTGEKVALPSRAMKITPVPFVKETHGGSVDVSRQDIDWTSPSAWDALIRDLADIYGLDTEFAVSTDMATQVTQTVPAATDDLKGIADALYAAALLAYRGGAAAGEPAAGKLPDYVWVSLDMWARLGPVVDANVLAFPPTGLVPDTAGESRLDSFAGNILRLPRVVVPTFPDGTIILGNSALWEVYEEVVGLLTAVEPSLFGVEVAYGGYVAFAPLNADAFAAITLPAAP